MKRVLFLTILCVGLIHANFLSSLFSEESEEVQGLSFSLRPAGALKYNHTLGGGSYAEGTDGGLDGYYYACGEMVSMMLLVSTDSMYSQSSSAVITLDLSAHAALKPKATVNNCKSNAVDIAQTCVSGGSILVSSQGLSIQLTKLSKSSKVVVRIDLNLDCSGLSTGDGPALTLNSYKVGSAGTPCTVSGVSVNFIHTTAVYDCNDYDACTTDIVAGCLH